MTFHRNPLAAQGLVQLGGLVGQLPALYIEDQVAFGVKPHAFSAFETHEDAPGVSSRRHDKVIFHVPLVETVDHVDAGVDLGEIHPGILPHADLPFRLVAAKEIAGAAGQDALALDRGAGIGALQFHAQHKGRFGLIGLGPAQHGDGFRSGQVEVVAGGAGKELHRSVGLALVGLEVHGDLQGTGGDPGLGALHSFSTGRLYRGRILIRGRRCHIEPGEGGA